MAIGVAGGCRMVGIDRICYAKRLVPIVISEADRFSLGKPMRSRLAVGGDVGQRAAEQDLRFANEIPVINRWVSGICSTVAASPIASHQWRHVFDFPTTKRWSE